MSNDTSDSRVAALLAHLREQQWTVHEIQVADVRLVVTDSRRGAQSTQHEGEPQLSPAQHYAKAFGIDIPGQMPGDDG